jgi:hypothetical protein
LISFNAISGNKLRQLAIDFNNSNYSNIWGSNIFLRVSLKAGTDINPGTKGT